MFSFSFYLAPNQTVVEDDLGGSVNVTPADPGSGHREDTDKHSDISTRQHSLFLDRGELMELKGTN